MEGQLVWKEDYNIGVDIIDQEQIRVNGHARRESNSSRSMPQNIFQRKKNTWRPSIMSG